MLREHGALSPADRIGGRIGGMRMLTLYFAPGSSSMAPHIALHEIGVDFEARPLSLARKEHRAPAYLALNPEGKVPTLLIDGRPLTEVAGILLYLAKRFPAAGLLPTDDIEAEAQVVSWMSFVAATIHPARRRSLDEARAAFAIADKRLGDGPWAVGRYSIADIHLFRLYWRLVGSLSVRGSDPSPLGLQGNTNVQARGLPPASEFPNLDAHYRRMLARPAVQKTCEIEARIGYELPG